MLWHWPRSENVNGSVFTYAHFIVDVNLWVFSMSRFTEVYRFSVFTRWLVCVQSTRDTFQLLSIPEYHVTVGKCYKWDYVHHWIDGRFVMYQKLKGVRFEQALCYILQYLETSSLDGGGVQMTIRRDKCVDSVYPPQSTNEISMPTWNRYTWIQT